MFDLPETIPQKNKKKGRAIALAAGIHVLLVATILVATIIVVQMAMPEKLGELQLLTTLYMAPPPPPPPLSVSKAPEPRRHAAVEKTSPSETPAVVESEPVPVEKPELTAPVRVPKDIAKIVDTAPPSGASGARSGVIGGATTGLPGGLLGGVLGGTGNVPPPPPPPAPVRVGGNVKQPKVVHIEQPKYPPEARRARVEGVVILEATVTAEGTVDKVKVISGPPMLTAAAVEALTHWKYEPTYLNGQAVPVIPTARISFSLSGTPR